MSRCEVTAPGYRVLFADDRYSASGISAVAADGRLLLAALRASDGERGVATLLFAGDEAGERWSEPQPLGPPLADAQAEFQGVGLAHVLPDGRVVACGIHLPKGYDPSKPDDLYRPGEILIGHARPEELAFSWSRIPSGQFLDEQFIAPGVQLDDGRLIFTLWGSASKDDNWQCGVLLSDDGGATLRYSQIAYEPDHAIRARPGLVAGFNEQTLFALPGGQLVSIIRGRARLGAIAGSTPHSSECLFFRSVSTDRGETWSAPQLTNLPGTGAPSDGLVLPDRSLLLPARIPSVWSRHQGHNLYGLNVARSYDMGLTWQSELVITRTPGGELFDNYYNAMNGTFMATGAGKAQYLFGHHRPGTKSGHPAYALQLNWDV